VSEQTLIVCCLCDGIVYLKPNIGTFFLMQLLTTSLPRSQRNKTLLSEVDHYLVSCLSDYGIFWKLYIA